jgi:hypothetical protein
MSPQKKMNSLTEMGFKIEVIEGKDPKGNDWVFKVTGPAPQYFIKQTKTGRLLAFTSQEATTESTIQGLSEFKEKNGDLVGKRYTPKKKATPEPAQGQTQPAAPVSA